MHNVFDMISLFKCMSALSLYNSWSWWASCICTILIVDDFMKVKEGHRLLRNWSDEWVWGKYYHHSKLVHHASAAMCLAVIKQVATRWSVWNVSHLSSSLLGLPRSNLRTFVNIRFNFRFNSCTLGNVPWTSIYTAFHNVG